MVKVKELLKVRNFEGLSYRAIAKVLISLSVSTIDKKFGTTKIHRKFHEPLKKCYVSAIPM